jgi:hypothetical protein
MRPLPLLTSSAAIHVRRADASTDASSILVMIASLD